MGCVKTILVILVRNNKAITLSTHCVADPLFWHKGHQRVCECQFVLFTCNGGYLNT